MAMGTALLLLGGCNSMPERRYTCAEMLGVPPRQGYIAILPPGYSTISSMQIDPRSGSVVEVPDFRMWDERDHLVCDERGKDVER
jgi:hypothetical protein